MRSAQAPQPKRLWGLRRALGISLGVLVWLGGPGAAVAAPDEPVRVLVDGGRLSFDRMAPGIGRAQELTVSTQGPSTEIRFGVDDLVSADNGCLEQEIRAGDTTCDEGGELAPWLLARVERVGGPEDVVLFEGPLGRLDLRETVDSASPLRLRLSILPDVDMGNDTMTDSVAFTLWWAVDGRVGAVRATGDADVAPAHGSAEETVDDGILAIGWAALALGLLLAAVGRLAGTSALGRHAA